MGTSPEHRSRRAAGLFPKEGARREVPYAAGGRVGGGGLRVWCSPCVRSCSAGAYGRTIDPGFSPLSIRPPASVFDTRPPVVLPVHACVVRRGGCPVRLEGERRCAKR